MGDAEGCGYLLRCVGPLFGYPPFPGVPSGRFCSPLGPLFVMTTQTLMPVPSPTLSWKGAPSLGVRFAPLAPCKPRAMPPRHQAPALVSKCHAPHGAGARPMPSWPPPPPAQGRVRMSRPIRAFEILSRSFKQLNRCRTSPKVNEIAIASKAEQSPHRTTLVVMIYIQGTSCRKSAANGTSSILLNQ